MTFLIVTKSSEHSIYTKPYSCTHLNDDSEKNSKTVTQDLFFKSGQVNYDRPQCRRNPKYMLSLLQPYRTNYNSTPSQKSVSNEIKFINSLRRCCISDTGVLCDQLIGTKTISYRPRSSSSRRDVRGVVNGRQRWLLVLIVGVSTIFRILRFACVKIMFMLLVQVQTYFLWQSSFEF